jgi:hypothetical protein
MEREPKPERERTLPTFGGASRPRSTVPDLPSDASADKVR